MAAAARAAARAAPRSTPGLDIRRPIIIRPASSRHSRSEGKAGRATPPCVREREVSPTVVPNTAGHVTGDASHIEALKIVRSHRSSSSSSWVQLSSSTSNPIEALKHVAAVNALDAGGRTARRVAGVADAGVVGPDAHRVRADAAERLAAVMLPQRADLTDVDPKRFIVRAGLYYFRAIAPRK